MSEVIGQLADAVERGAGEALVGILAVGPGVDPPRHEGSIAPQLLLVVKRLPLPVLSNLAHQLQQIAGDARVRILTERELLRGADVFALELAEYRARHRVVRGRNPLDDLHYTAGELRLGIERSLRMLTRDLRDAMLAGPSLDVFAQGLDQLAVVAAHLLPLVGPDAGGEAATPSDSEQALLAALGRRVGHATEELERLRVMVRRGDEVSPFEAVAALLALAKAATPLIDAFGADD